MTTARRASKVALGGTLLLVAVASASSARANGRFPNAGQLVVHPEDPDTLVVQTTYGFITTRDHGATWGWTCEQAAFYADVLDPPLGLTRDGTLVGGVFDGLIVSHDGCSYELVPGELADKYMVDVSIERVDPSRAIAVSSNGMSNETFSTQVWGTDDDGATWSQVGVDLPTDFLAITGDVAPTDPDRIYLSGLVPQGGANYAGYVARSVDRGETWERFEVAGSMLTSSPFLAGVDVENPDVLYVRLDGDAGRLLRSEDAGETWVEIFAGAGKLTGFALSPDGAYIAVGGDADGIWRAEVGPAQFAKVSPVGAQCLTWVERGLYACGREALDGFTVGLSTDLGATFEPLHHVSCLEGPLDCEASTEVGAECTIAWPATAAVLLTNTCQDGAGGTGGAVAADGPGEGGCCSVAPGRGGRDDAPGVVALALAALAAWWRRNR